MNPFHLSVLGYPVLRAPNGDPVRFRTKKHLALLIFLAVEQGRPHRRDKLATMFWPRAPLLKGRHSLATALSVLRGSVGRHVFDTDRDSIGVRKGWIVADLGCSEGLSLLGGRDRACETFLQDFELADLHDFEEWRQYHRAKQLSSLDARITICLDNYRRQGDVGAMEKLATQLLELNPYSEEGLRASMEARALLGDRIGAIRLFKQWRDKLADELGASPRKDIARMAKQLAAMGGTQAHPVAISSSRIEAEAPTEPYGYTAEYARCRALWNRAISGAPTRLLLRGDFGSGKSTLSAALLSAVALEGANTAWISCAKDTSGVFLAALSRLVTSLMKLPGAASTTPGCLRILEDFVPTLSTKCAPYIHSSAPDAPKATAHVWVAFADLVSAVASERPLMVVIDDCQYMDTLTRECLAALPDYTSNVPALFVQIEDPPEHSYNYEISYNPTESAADGLHLITLSGLASPLGESLIETLERAQAPLDSTTRRALVNCAQGNPLLITSLGKDYHRASRIPAAVALSAFGDTSLQSTPTRFSSHATSVLHSLRPDTQFVAQVASVLGTRLNDISFYAAFGITLRGLAVAINELLQRGVLVTEPEGSLFRNGVVRGCLYESIPTPIRQGLHRATAAQLLSLIPRSAGIDQLEIAWHLTQANQSEKATALLLSGGFDAIRSGRPLLAASAVAESIQLVDGSEQQTASCTLARAKQEMGCWEESLRILESREPWSTTGNAAHATILRATNERFLGVLFGDRLQASIDDLLAIVSDRKLGTSLRATAAAATITLISSSRRTEDIHRLASATDYLLEAHRDDYDHLHILLARAWCIAQTDGSSAALSPLLEGVAILDRTNTADSVASRLLLGAGVSLCQVGKYEDALPVLKRAHSVAQGLGNRALLGNAHSGLALAHGRLGDYGAQVSHAEESLRLSGNQEWGICFLSATYERGLGLACMDRFVEAEAAMTEFDVRFESRVPAWVEQAWRLCKADVLLLTGNERKALQAGRLATSGDLTELHHECFAGPFARWVAYSAMRSGVSAGALVRLQPLFDTVDRHDAKDQAEIVTCQVALNSEVAGRTEDLREAVAAKLVALPGSTQSLIRRLGVGPNLSGSKVARTEMR